MTDETKHPSDASELADDALEAAAGGSRPGENGTGTRPGPLSGDSAISSDGHGFIFSIT